MKISKTFRLSEQAVEILNRQESPTQFLEDLILKQKSNSLNIQYITRDEVIELIEERVGGMQPEVSTTALRVPISDLKKRAIPDILVDIDTLKRQCAEELEYCQDPETRHSIEDEYRNRIQALWDEYKALKEAK